MRQRINDLWIVRYTNWVLVGWFVLMGCAMSGLVLWPQFQHYVQRLAWAKQVIAAEALHVELQEMRAERRQALRDVGEQLAPFAPTDLAAHFVRSGLQVVEMQSRPEQWTVRLKGSAEALWRGAMTLLLTVQGLDLRAISMRSEDGAVLMTLELKPVRHPRRWMHEPTVSAMSEVRFGALSPCPQASVRGRVGDTLWLQQQSGPIRQQLGHWLTPDWRIVGIYQSQLVLKSDLGTTCRSGEAP